MRHAFALLVLTNCAAGYQSASEHCWSQLRGSQFGSALSNQKRSEVADALERQRCTALEQEERAVDRVRRAQRAENERIDAAQQQEERRRRDAVTRQQQAARAVNAAELAEVRRKPKVPEVGGTVAEAEVICGQQRGVSTVHEGKVICALDGITVFVCTEADRRLNRCDAYHEGGDLTAFRQAAESEYGPATRESLSPKGFRVFMWERGKSTIAVSMYSGGVRTTVSHERIESDETARVGDAGVEPDRNPYERKTLPASQVTDRK